MSGKSMVNRKIVWGFITIFITLVITVSYMELWGTDINVPLTAFRADSVGVLLEANNYIRGGNVHEYACFGAPNIGDYWYNMGDSSVPIPFIKLLSGILGSVTAAVNVHAILNCILMAISMYWICIKWEIRESAALIAGVSFSSLSYFALFTNTQLLIYGACFYIPLFCYAIIEIMRKENNINLKKLAFILGVMLYVGLNSAYYAFFSMIILAFVGLYVLLCLKSVDKVLTVFLCYVSIGCGIATYTMPNIMHNVFHFDDLWNSDYYYLVCVTVGIIIAGLGFLFYKKIYPHLTIRTIWIFILGAGILVGVAFIFVSKYTNFLGAYEGRSLEQVQSMTYNIVNIFLPAVNTIYDKVNEEMRLLVDLENNDFTVLGILAGIGFFTSVLYIFRFEKEEVKDEILGLCGKSNCFLVFVAIRGGISLVIAMFITTGIRNYSRMCIFIACFALISFAILLDKVLDKISIIDKVAIKSVLKIGVCGVVIFGLTLSIPTSIINENSFGNSYGYVEYEERKKEYDTWQELMYEIETSVPKESMILQLPFYIEEEQAVELMIHGQEHEKAIPPILSKTTIWSYLGEINESDKADNIERLLLRAGAYGFKGIYVDTLLYGDDSYKDVLGQIEKYLGNPIVCSENRRFFYNMEEYTEKVQVTYSEEELEAIRKGLQ